jgi:hypothetical protein
MAVRVTSIVVSTAAVVSALVSTLAAGPVEKALAEAQAELSRTQQLVEAGVAPRKQLEEVRARFEEIRDDATLSTTLYAQIELNQFTPELAGNMMLAANNRLARRQTAVDDARRLTEAGVLPRTALTPLLEELDRARRTRDEATLRAQQFEQLTEMARAEAAEAVADAAHQENHDQLPAAIRFDGKGVFNDALWHKVVLAFEKQFGHGLTVSAKGDTLFHRSLGFDHRGKIDVAIDPDSDEGQWLRQFLETQQIPYFAYRRAVAGQASGAHVHLGPPSPRWQS